MAAASCRHRRAAEEATRGESSIDEGLSGLLHEGAQRVNFLPRLRGHLFLIERRGSETWGALRARRPKHGSITLCCSPTFGFTRRGRGQTKDERWDSSSSGKSKQLSSSVAGETDERKIEPARPGRRAISTVSPLILQRLPSQAHILQRHPTAVCQPRLDVLTLRIYVDRQQGQKRPVPQVNTRTPRRPC